jgi:exopolysaccharide biosynthesis polyprenyl glycosylphosphotransferase
MIPRRFFWFFDGISILAAFLASAILSAWIRDLIESKGVLKATWVAALYPEQSWEPLPISHQIWILVVAAFPIIIFLEIAGNYGKWVQQSMIRIIAAGPVASVLGLSMVSLVPFALRNPSIRLSRLLLFSFVILSAIGLTGYRLALRIYYRKKQAAGYYAKNVLLIGLPAAVEWMTRYFAEAVSTNEYRIFGCLQLPSVPQVAAASTTSDKQNEPTDFFPLILGHVSELGDLLIRKPIHEVIAVQPASGGEWVPRVIQDCDNLGILLRVIPEALLLGETVRLRTLFPFQTLHLPAVVLTPPHWDSDALFIKRLIDFVLSGILLIVLSPVFLLIALAIKISTPRLPVFHKWRVVGRNGVEFTGYKFTTMAADAEERRQELMERNEMTGPVFKIKDDPRVTPLGRFLRKYSLNELPQLWSVLKGDMSLVGPRPAFRHELERYEFWHKRKLSIKPGITCLWQVRGRNRINRFDDWVEMDLEYIDNWSLWLDFKILLRTFWVVIAGTGS